MSSGINKVLFAGGPEQIILFDFLEDQPQLSRVSKGMKAACERAANARLRARLELRDPGTVSTARTEAERICNGRPLESVLAELMAEVGDRVRRFHAVSPHIWDRIREMYAAYVEKDPETRDETCGQRLLVGLQNMIPLFDCAEQARRLADQQLVARIPMPDAAPAMNDKVSCAQTMALDSAANNASQKLYDFIWHFLAQEKLAARAKDLPLAQGRQQPEQLAEFLTALRSRQEGFNLTASQKRRFDEESQKPGALSRGAFLAREQIGVEGAAGEDAELRRLWRQIRAILNRGPAYGAPLIDIRTWIYHPDRTRDQDFAQIQDLGIARYYAVPPAIEVLTSLRSLRFYRAGGPVDPLAGLPNEMRALVNLEQLEFNNTTSFDEIPPILEELPALRRLTITGNNRPIREFPSWLDNKINSGFSGWFRRAGENEIVQIARLDRFLGLRLTNRGAVSEREVNSQWNRQYAGLPHEEFTDVPFNIWFREKFSVPNIYIYGVQGLIELSNRLRTPGFFNQGWLELTRALIFPLIPTAAFIGSLIGVLVLESFGFPLLALGGGIGLTISCCAIVTNAIIHNTIGRLAEAVYVAYQEEMGAEDPQMFHVRDIPQPQAAAVDVRQIPNAV